MQQNIIHKNQQQKNPIQFSQQQGSVQLNHQQNLTQMAQPQNALQMNQQQIVGQVNQQQMWQQRNHFVNQQRMNQQQPGSNQMLNKFPTPSTIHHQPRSMQQQLQVCFIYLHFKITVYF